MKRPGTQTAAVCSATAKMGHRMMTMMRCGADDEEVDDRVWRSSACLHDDEIMSAKAFAFIMYNILFHSLSLSLFSYFFHFHNFILFRAR